MEDWDYDSNTGVDPTKVGRGSHVEVSWKCHKCDHIWSAQIYNRANGKGCPCCANRVVVPGKNDLATTDPELAAEWHPTLNEYKPTEVTRGQGKKAVNLVTEYGAKLHGCKYAIASKHPQWKMEKRFEESLDQFRPYIFLTRKEYAAILESQQNDDKFHKSKEGVSKMLKPKFKFTLVPQFPANLL